VKRRTTGTIILVIVVLLPALGMLAGGIFEIVVIETGTPAQARITECHDVGGRYRVKSCIGTWVTGGSLVGGKGHVVIGTVDGASADDVGQSIDVRLAGDRAYTPSLRIPIILLTLGLGGTILAVNLIRSVLRRPRAGDAPSRLAGTPVSEPASE
jgi:hypothetical protein